MSFIMALLVALNFHLPGRVPANTAGGGPVDAPRVAPADTGGGGPVGSLHVSPLDTGGGGPVD